MSTPTITRFELADDKSELRADLAGSGADEAEFRADDKSELGADLVGSGALVLTATSTLADAELLHTLDQQFAVRRAVEANIIRLTGELAARSGRELRRTGVSAVNADTGPAAALARIGRIALSEAHRFVRVGASTATTLSLTGEPIQPRYPHLAAAIADGDIPLDAAAAIVSNLDQVSDVADPDDRDFVEAEVVAYARDSQTDWVRALAIDCRDRLDPDGTEPREENLVQKRRFTSRVLRNGMQRTTWDTDPLTAASLNAYIDGYAAAVFHSGRGNETDRAEEPTPDEPDLQRELVDPRTRAQLASDAMAEMIAHVSHCEQTASSMPKTCIVVRMTLDGLLSGLGRASVDGIEQPISAATARRMAAEADLIPIVLGGQSEVLDLGRSRRLFTRKQRLALAETFPGCAACERPPSWTEAHHIRWYQRDGGLTNLENAIPLCSSHHHAVHDNGWEVVMKNGVPWFVPPSALDVYRTPRRGRSLPRIELPSG